MHQQRGANASRATPQDDAGSAGLEAAVLDADTSSGPGTEKRIRRRTASWLKLPALSFGSSLHDPGRIAENNCPLQMMCREMVPSFWLSTRVPWSASLLYSSALTIALRGHSIWPIRSSRQPDSGQ